MNANRRFARLVTGLVVLGVVLGGWSGTSSGPPDERSEFVRALDLSALGNAAVYSDGRIKSFDSFANGIVSHVTGPRGYRGQSPAVTYLDLLFRPDANREADILWVKNKPLRAEIVEALSAIDPEARTPGPARDRVSRFLSRRDEFLESGFIAEPLLDEPRVAKRLADLGADLIRWSKFVQMLRGARFYMRPDVLYDRLRMLPPPEGSGLERWVTLHALVDAPPSDPDPVVAALRESRPELAESLAADFRAMRSAWRDQDAAAVSRHATSLTESLREVNPGVYPDASRLAWESTYFRLYNLTWIWMVYLLAVILLLLALVYQWRWSYLGGIGLFGVAFLLHTAATGLRWYVSGRWPNSNMFEAVTTSAWMGGVAAVLLAPFARATLTRILLLLTSAVASMVAMMSAYYLPVHLNPNIENKMPVLHDVWLYIHTNVIIWSYIVIFMAAVSGILYLLWRMCGGGPAYSRAGGAVGLASVGGGAATLSASGGSGPPRGEGDRSYGVVLDGVTMDLMKIAFVMLWAGLVMGAIWADHSWGRPWGWDPKEVFALNTFLVFAVLVHARLKVRDKGLWTAWLAVIGAGVMLFNWIVINFQITGLHSYA